MTVSVTSRIAFSNIKLNQNEEKVFEALKEIGLGTNDDIATKLNWPIHCVTGRTNGLWKKGLIILVDRSGISRMGNKAQRWAIADPGYRQLSFINEQDCED